LRRSSFSRALEADEKDHRRRLRLELEARRLASAQERRQLIADDLHDLLPRRQALQDLFTRRLRPNAGEQRADDPDVHVGLEKSHPDLAEGPLEDLLGDPRLPAQGVEDASEAFGERVEHESVPVKKGA